MNMPSRAWNIVFLVGFITYVCIRDVFARRTEGNEKIVRRLDALEGTLLISVGAGSLLLPLLYLFTPWLAFADYHLPAFVPWCGTMLMLPALWLFYRSHADLGPNWSVTLEIRKGHHMVKKGVYRWIRHPMYASILLWDIAQGLLLQNWLAGWCAFVTFAVMYLVRTPREERMMCEFFGQEYRDYMLQTGRLCPSLRFKERT
jgi:protein-S-isoprenylcysteine O-methyltransferase Ste14